MESLKAIPYLALVIAVSGIILGASALTVSKFGATMTQCYNSSYTFDAVGACVNTSNIGASGQGNLNYSNEYFAIYQTQNANSDVAEQIPTIAIIAVMTIIISIVAGVFVYLQYFN